MLLALGAFMLVWMLVTGHVNGWLVTAALACLGVPTGLQARALSKAGFRPPPGPGSSSPPEVRSSRSSRSSSSRTEESDEPS
ncbi:hypothetical protein ACQP1P_38490 [Dactylosporangium sp. CA-052675]|uniref:hypothetical protein n=1 Tax=Dactylosporangium sp. CA-052675 TaxID=3239927 RepID=UPI003D8E4442